MKFLLCIPVDLPVESTKRAESKGKGRAHLVEMSRNPEATAAILRDLANTSNFLVRAIEDTYMVKDANKE